MGYIGRHPEPPRRMEPCPMHTEDRGSCVRCPFDPEYSMYGLYILYKYDPATSNRRLRQSRRGSDRQRGIRRDELA